MAAIAVPLQVLGTLASFSGQLTAGRAAEAAGKSQKQALDYQAGLLEQQAGQERATAQRRAYEERRKATLVGSRAQAVAAASGGGALDPTVLEITGDIAGEGEYNALTQMFTGEERALGLENEAALRRYEGDEALRAGKIRKKQAKIAAIGTLLSGLGEATLMAKYGSGPSKPTPQQAGYARLANSAYYTPDLA